MSDYFLPLRALHMIWRRLRWNWITSFVSLMYITTILFVAIFCARCARTVLDEMDLLTTCVLRENSVDKIKCPAFQTTERSLTS